MPAIIQYLALLLTVKIDTIILRCTPYPFFQDLLQKQASAITFVSAANALPPFEMAANIPSIYFLTTVPVAHLKQAVEGFLVKEHGYRLTLTSNQDL